MRWIFCLFLFFVPSIFIAQTVLVLHAEDNTPLEFATLSSPTAREFIATDVEGQADVSVFKGVADIQVRLVGFETLHLSYDSLAANNFICRLSPMLFDLNQVVVSASRWRQPKQSTPAKINTISKQAIALQNPQTAADLLEQSGVVFVQKSQLGGGSPMIRGFSTNRLLYAVDGVRMNTAIFRSGNLQNVISLDPFAIENAEVLFGPGSVIYGSDAIGGVMSFETLNPELSDSEVPLITGKVVGRYASASNENSFHFDVAVGKEKWAFLSSFTHNKFGDLRMGRFGPDDYLRPWYIARQDGQDIIVENPDPLVQVPTGYSQFNLLQKVRYQPNDTWEFNYGLHYSTTTDFPRYDRLIRLRGEEPRSAEWSYGPQVWMMNNLYAGYNNPNLLFDRAQLRMAVQHFEESRIDRDFNSTGRSVRTEQVAAYSVNLDFKKSLGKRSVLYYGTEWIINDVDSEGEIIDLNTNVASAGAARYPESSWQSYGIYLSTVYDVSSILNVQAGARYSTFNIEADFSNNAAFYPLPELQSSLQHSAFTGSLGAVLSPKEDLTLAVNLATAFRSPNIDDIGKVFDSEPGAVVVPNTQLNSEYAYNVELSATKIFGRRCRLDLTAYYTLLDNALVRRNFTLSGRDSILYQGELSQVQAVQNAAAANVYGMQAELEIKFGGGFSLSSSFNYQVGEEELDDGLANPSRHAAPWFGNTRVMYKYERFNFQLYSVYQGARAFEDLPLSEQNRTYLYTLDNNGKPYAPSWYTLNIKTLYNVNETITISAGIENLTDRRYRPYSSGIAAAGRNMVIALRVGFK
jgi:hemoglobin/transferrin/lactoferrin receptor protein